MPPAISYLIAAAVGVVVAHLVSRPPDLRAMRLSQLLFVPCATVVCFSGLNAPGMPGFMVFLAGLFFLIILLAPNLAYFCGAGLANFLDRQDWTPLEEEIALRPLRLLIDRENYRQALGELEEILKTHQATYEAVLIKAKLLNHIGRVNEAETALLELIALSKGAAQQLSVMQMLSSLEMQPADPPPTVTPGVRRIEIGHELVLMQMNGETPAPHREIPPGSYPVEEIIHDGRSWLKLAGEEWGNAEMCWRAVPPVAAKLEGSPKNGLFRRIARTHQTIAIAIKGKPHRLQVAGAQSLFNEANQFIRNNDWQSALPLLEQASAANPDRYEFAYRRLQAVRQTSGAAAAAKVLTEVLGQSQWSKNEEDMLKQLGGGR